MEVGCKYLKSFKISMEYIKKKYIIKYALEKKRILMTEDYWFIKLLIIIVLENLYLMFEEIRIPKVYYIIFNHGFKLFT